MCRRIRISVYRPNDVDQLSVRNDKGDMVPIGTLVKIPRRQPARR